MSKEILLTQSKVAIVDDEQYENLNKFKWHAQKDGNTFYALREIKIGSKKTKISMHRIVLNVKGENVIDHIDGNGLNNQISNLRMCSHSENKRNRKSSKNNFSGFKGVYWSNRSNKWRSRINLNGKCIHVGLFSCLIKAVKAYNEAALKYHGEFAKLNKI